MQNYSEALDWIMQANNEGDSSATMMHYIRTKLKLGQGGEVFCVACAPFMFLVSSSSTAFSRVRLNNSHLCDEYTFPALVLFRLGC